ncbi:MAG TPA: glycosyltransferase family 4 protein [Candidatus Eisenbacteria bacterium]|nr:glycosyltransferase family 4 protein [Candidatus Eisenbacteria bacterium]
MRIAILKNNYVLSAGGSERYTNGLVAELMSRGHEVHVLAAHWDSAAVSTGVTLHRVPTIKGPSFVRALSFALGCQRAADGMNCDVVVSVERTIRQDICRAGGGCHREWLNQRRRYRPWPRGDLMWLNPLHFTMLWIEKRTYAPRNTRCIIANSHRGKEEIVRHYQFPAERIQVIHNGVDCDRFRPAPKKPERREIVLLFVGSGFERKGLGFAVQALARMPAAVRLEVAGKGNPSPYRRLAKRLGVADRLRFLGNAAPIEEIYASGDILVHPAIYEPFSNACLEALACGLPVITTSINGASEIIRSGGNGNVIEDPANIPALATAIEPFLDPAVRAQTRDAARQTAAALPLSLNVEKTLAVIESMRTQRQAEKLADQF